MSDVRAAAAPAAGADVRPYIIKTYDRWIMLVLVLVAGWFLFRPIFAFSVYYRGVSFEHMLAINIAEHYYRKSISVYPRIPEGWLGLGSLQEMRGRENPGDYQSAIETFKSGIAYNPKDATLPWQLCRTYYEIGKDYRGALGACQAALKNDPSNKFAWDYAAWASFHLGDRDQALAYWREAVKRGHLRATEFIERYSKHG